MWLASEDGPLQAERLVLEPVLVLVLVLVPVLVLVLVPQLL